MTQISQMNISENINCVQCQGLMRQKYQVSNLNNFIVLKFGIFHANQKNSNFYFQDPSLSPIQVSNENFDVFGVIFHIGSVSTAGHYISYIRINNSWYEADDLQQVGKKVMRLNWPTKLSIPNKVPYLMFLQKRN